MGLADRYAGRAPAPKKRPITCARYAAVEGTRRCQHYLEGGACALPDEFMCVEWLKANGHGVPASRPEPVAVEEDRPAPVEAPPKPARPQATDLFGKPLPEAVPAPRSATRVPPEPPLQPPASSLQASSDAPVVRDLTDEDIASFEALGVEVCLATEGVGEVWLVPEYSGREDRKEISVRDAATLAAVCSAFPGARVTRFDKPAPEDP